MRSAASRVLERFAEKEGQTDTDGAELTLFIWREFCERSSPPPIKGLSVDQTIALLRDDLARRKAF